MWYVVYPDELYHHGIKGQKWGIRRYQNPDGSYTAAGKKRYGIDGSRNKGTSKSNDSSGSEKKGLSDKQKKALKVGAAVGATALAAVGGYALYKSGKLDNVIAKGRDSLEIAKKYKATDLEIRAKVGVSNAKRKAREVGDSLVSNKTRDRVRDAKETAALNAMLFSDKAKDAQWKAPLYAQLIGNETKVLGNKIKGTASGIAGLMTQSVNDIIDQYEAQRPHYSGTRSDPPKGARRKGKGV